MKTQYIIAKARDSETLTKEVQSKIDEGWMPQGGVSLCLATSPYFVQALILKTE